MVIAENEKIESRIYSILKCLYKLKYFIVLKVEMALPLKWVSKVRKHSTAEV